MITLYEIAELITSHPNDLIYCNMDKGDNIYLPFKEYKKITKNFNDPSISPSTFESIEIVFNNKSKLLILPYFDKKDLKKIIDEFNSIHQKEYCFKTIAQIYKQMLNDSIFKDCWINFLCDVIASCCLKFYEYNKLKEDEASPELYKRVLDLLKKYKKGNYEKIFSDSQCFTISFDNIFGEDALCTIMGNAGITNGISFYIHGKATAMHSLVCHDQTQFDEYYVPTMVFLGKQMTFYFENECSNKEEAYGELNPFGEDDSITSFVPYSGTSYHCYLTISMAHAAIRYLTKLLQGMKSFIIQAKKLDLDNESYNFIIQDNLTFLDDIENLRNNFNNSLPIDIPFLKEINKKDKIKMHTTEKWDFAIRYLPGAYLVEDEGRICNWVFYFCFFDHDSGDVVHFELVPPKFMDCLTALNEKLIEIIKEIGIATTVYISTIFDGFFLASTIGIENKIKDKLNIEFSSDMHEEIHELSKRLIKEFEKESDA